MTIIYITVILTLSFFIWLITRRKWKALIWTIATLSMLTITAWFVFLEAFQNVLKEECDNSRMWKFEKYVIVERRCLGISGPNQLSLLLYKDNKKIEEKHSIDNSKCIYEFNSNKDTLVFDICNGTLK